jgi:hypothetical protein
MITLKQRKTIQDQIGTGNILAISGGRVWPLEDGVILPVSYGYQVHITLDPSDSYTVKRIFRQGSKNVEKGTVSSIYCHQLAETAYRAGMYHSYDEAEWLS